MTPERATPEGRTHTAEARTQIGNGSERDADTDERTTSIVYWKTDERKTLDELSTRERLIDAGWRTADSVEIGKAFPGATTARVSRAAGVTTGSFFHHFPNAEAFASAMIRDMTESSGGTTPTELTELAGRRSGSAAVDLREMVRANLISTWERFAHDSDAQARFRSQIRLWSHYPMVYDDGGSTRTVGDAVRQLYMKVSTRAVALWEPAVELSGLAIPEPFSPELVSTVAFALFEGLAIRAAVDPESVPPTLWADACAAMLDGVTRPAGATVTLGDDSYEVVHPTESRSPQARSGAQRRHETRSRIVAACGGMFSEGWESVAATEVANRAEVSTQTITNLFGSVRAVAAATFASQAQAMYRNALGRSGEDPRAGLREALRDLTVRCRADPEVARALLAERIASFSNRGRSIGEMDVRLEVPISGALGLWLGRMGLTGDAGLAMSTTLADFALTNAIVMEGSADDIVDLAFRLLPDDIASGKLARQY